MRCNILGYGWFGGPLGHYLRKCGHDVKGSTRSQEKKDKLQSTGLETFILNPPSLPPIEDSEVIIINIPPFEGQLEWFKTWEWKNDHWPVFISSTSVLPLPETKNAELLKAEEDFFRTFKKHTILRFGGLLGNGRHPGKYLSGRKNLERPHSPVNLLHLDDAVKVTAMILERNLNHHEFNVVSSEHPTRKEFYTSFCVRNNLPLPEFNEDDKSTGKLVSNADLLPYYPNFRPLE